MSENFFRDFKQFFIRGLGALLPTLATLMVVIYVFTFFQEHVSRRINVAVLWAIDQVWTLLASPQTTEESARLAQRISDFKGAYTDYFSWIGFIVALVGVYFLGRFVGSLLGRGILRMLEQSLLRIPIFKQIFPHIKQVTDFLFSSSGKASLKFSRVVAVEYPRRGIWALGLVTGPAMRKVHEALGGEMLSIFVPSSPTPMTGYTIMVRREMIIDLPLSIDDALRFVISGGVIVPQGQQLTPDEIQRALTGSKPPEESKETSV